MPIIRAVARRVYVPSLYLAEIQLPESQAHHLRDVLRLQVGDTVELFDDSGNVAQGTLVQVDAEQVSVQVDSIQRPSARRELIIASAIPKSDRADWMIEKLSEVGVTRFIPLQTARSVVHPTGSGKRDRWLRIATESAKQSHRTGVMQIDPLTPVKSVLVANAIFCTTEQATPLAQFDLSTRESVTILIGPEGGWSAEEIAMFRMHNLTGAKLTETILRVETAAVAAAVIAATRLLNAYNPPAEQP